MIAYAACVGDPAKLARCAAPGLRRAMRDGDAFAELTADRGSLAAAYDEALEHFAQVPDLEALVLLHEDTELLDADFGDRVRRTFAAAPDVAVCGVVGARGVTSLAWWEGEVAGRCAEPRGVVEGRPAPAEVDSLDGLLLVLSPWAVRHLRFGDAPGFHGYDAEVCFAARAAGRRVVVLDANVFHHTKGGYGDPDAFARADAAFRARWTPAAAGR